MGLGNNVEGLVVSNFRIGFWEMSRGKIGNNHIMLPKTNYRKYEVSEIMG
jgi:hypothetical protein